MNSNRLCAGCKFWIAPQEGHSVAPPGAGECHRYPPQKAQPFGFIWTWTFPTDWCGEQTPHGMGRG